MIRENIIKIPANTKVGDVILIETLISHPMHSESKTEPQNVSFIKNLTVKFDSKEVFNAKLTPKISANPYISFYMKISKSGILSFTWTENTGRSWSETRKLSVKS